MENDSFMKLKHLLFFLVFFVSYSAKCDTLDFWSVYLNDELIGQFYEMSNEKKIQLKLYDLKESDQITVRYGSDHPCVDCIYQLSVMAEVKRHFPEAETSKQSGNLTISLKELIEASKEDNITKFAFYYSEKNSKPYIISELNGRLLFTLELK